MKPIGTQTWLLAGPSTQTLDETSLQETSSARDTISVQSAMWPRATTSISALSQPRATSAGRFAREPADAPLETEQFYDDKLQNAFDSLAHDIIEQVTEYESDVLAQATESVSEEIAADAYHRLIEALDDNDIELDEDDEADDEAPNHLLRLGAQAKHAYNSGAIGPKFASLIRLGEKQQAFLLSRSPNQAASGYVASLFKHEIAVAVSLVPTSVWPAAGQSRTYNACQVTTMSEERAMLYGLKKPVIVRHIQLRKNGVDKTLTALQVPWPDFAALPPAALAALAQHLQQLSLGRAIAIHCLAGQGRSGTLALATALAGRKEKATFMDALRLFLQLRLQRRSTIETGPQFAAAIKSAHH